MHTQLSVVHCDWQSCNRRGFWVRLGVEDGLSETDLTVDADSVGPRRRDVARRHVST